MFCLVSSFFACRLSRKSCPSKFANLEPLSHSLARFPLFLLFIDPLSGLSYQLRKARLSKAAGQSPLQGRLPAFLVNGRIDFAVAALFEIFRSLFSWIKIGHSQCSAVLPFGSVLIDPHVLSLSLSPLWSSPLSLALPSLPFVPFPFPLLLLCHSLSCTHLFTVVFQRLLPEAVTIRFVHSLPGIIQKACTSSPKLFHGACSNTAAARLLPLDRARARDQSSVVNRSKSCIDRLKVGKTLSTASFTCQSVCVCLFILTIFNFKFLNTSFTQLQTDQQFLIDNCVIYLFFVFWKCISKLQFTSIICVTQLTVT